MGNPKWYNKAGVASCGHGGRCLKGGEQPRTPEPKCLVCGSMPWARIPSRIGRDAVLAIDTRQYFCRGCKEFYQPEETVHATDFIRRNSWPE